MKIITPSYYKDFKCDPFNCEHNCCIGWEIDVDEDTLRKYSDINDEFGKKILKNIDTTTECIHFKLKENDRCPFLNENNLCEIILNKGEDYLCDICNDHPRYKNFFDGVCEIGVGLCCEIAGKIIISNKEKVRFELLTDEELSEEYIEYCSLRDYLLNICQDRSIPLKERIDNLLMFADRTDFNRDFIFWREKYLKLEKLDDKWFDKLNNIKNSDVKEEFISDWEVHFEQILVYFITRHLPDAFYDDIINEIIIFSVLSLYMIISVFYWDNIYIEKHLIEIARMYSSEIEYSDENIFILLKGL